MVCAQAVLCLVHIPLSLDIVGVESVFPGSASREMLDGDSDSVSCHAPAAPLYLSLIHICPVITTVLCTSHVRRIKQELVTGINVYRIQVIRIKDRNADKN